MPMPSGRLPSEVMQEDVINPALTWVADTAAALTSPEGLTGAGLAFVAAVVLRWGWRRFAAWARGEHLPIRPLAAALLEKLAQPELWRPGPVPEEVRAGGLTDEGCVSVTHSSPRFCLTAVVKGVRYERDYFNRREWDLLDAAAKKIAKSFEARRQHDKEAALAASVAAVRGAGDKQTAEGSGNVFSNCTFHECAAIPTEEKPGGPSGAAQLAAALKKPAPADHPPEVPSRCESCGGLEYNCVLEQPPKGLCVACSSKRADAGIARLEEAQKEQKCEPPTQSSKQKPADENHTIPPGYEYSRSQGTVDVYLFRCNKCNAITGGRKDRNGGGSDLYNAGLCVVCWPNCSAAERYNHREAARSGRKPAEPSAAQEEAVPEPPSPAKHRFGTCKNCGGPLDPMLRHSHGDGCPACEARSGRSEPKPTGSLCCRGCGKSAHYTNMRNDLCPTCRYQLDADVKAVEPSPETQPSASAKDQAKDYLRMIRQMVNDDTGMEPTKDFARHLNAVTYGEASAIFSTGEMSRLAFRLGQLFYPSSWEDLWDKIVKYVNTAASGTPAEPEPATPPSPYTEVESQHDRIKRYRFLCKQCGAEQNADEGSGCYKTVLCVACYGPWARGTSR